jgi:peptidoglycan hydrolase CwlO-like protein
MGYQLAVQVIKGLLWTLLGLPSLNLELLELCAALVLVGLFLLWRRRGTSTNTKQQGSETSKANRELEGLKEEVARLATQIMASETLDEVESLKDEVASLAMQIKELQEQRERRSAEAEGRKTEAPETTIAGGSST